MKKLFEGNTRCPECGGFANQDIRSCETGLSYCSHECATEHVKRVWPTLQAEEERKKKAERLAKALVDEGFDIGSFKESLESLGRAYEASLKDQHQTSEGSTQ